MLGKRKNGDIGDPLSSNSADGHNYEKRAVFPPRVLGSFLSDPANQKEKPEYKYCNLRHIKRAKCCLSG
jgi:hypothetical protein